MEGTKKDDLTEDELNQVSGGAYVSPCIVYSPEDVKKKPVIIKRMKISRIFRTYSTTAETIISNCFHLEDKFIERI